MYTAAHWQKHAVGWKDSISAILCSKVESVWPFFINATCCLWRISLHFWRVDAIMWGADKKKMGVGVGCFKLGGVFLFFPFFFFLFFFFRVWEMRVIQSMLMSSMWQTGPSRCYWFACRWELSSWSGAGCSPGSRCSLPRGDNSRGTER